MKCVCGCDKTKHFDDQVGTQCMNIKKDGCEKFIEAK